MEIISHLQSTVTPEFLHYILSALCIIFFLNGSSQNGLRRRIAFPARTAAIRWRYNRKNPARRGFGRKLRRCKQTHLTILCLFPLRLQALMEHWDQ
ncbi:unnamed protein product [Brassica oleracea var. botrytis]|uniref:(rape) hypothetical protein n=1 Tax=Brassica napus TaxID=3708 RepID=A0A816Q5L3_BRANA|nr:hypothetical protein HID58_070830 [Brassica napus]CAF2057590.1 unnamed protein product [Brassica napus]